MKKTINLTNADIYAKAEALLQAFPAEEESKIPVQALFLLRKNIKVYTELAQEIEKARIEIIQKYGKPSEEDENRYTFEGENIEKVNTDLNDLVSCEQEVSYYTFSLSALGDVEFSNAQMDAIMDFIEFDEGE